MSGLHINAVTKQQATSCELVHHARRRRRGLQVADKPCWAKQSRQTMMIDQTS